MTAINLNSFNVLVAAASAVPSSFASLIPSLDQDSNDVGRLQGRSTNQWHGTVLLMENDFCLY